MPPAPQFTATSSSPTSRPTTTDAPAAGFAVACRHKITTTREEHLFSARFDIRGQRSDCAVADDHDVGARAHHSQRIRVRFPEGSVCKRNLASLPVDSSLCPRSSCRKLWHLFSDIERARRMTLQLRSPTDGNERAGKTAARRSTGRIAVSEHQRTEIINLAQVPIRSIVDRGTRNTYLNTSTGTTGTVPVGSARLHFVDAAALCRRLQAPIRRDGATA